MSGCEGVPRGGVAATNKRGTHGLPERLIARCPARESLESGDPALKHRPLPTDYRTGVSGPLPLRPSKAVLAVEYASLGVAAVIAVLAAGSANWDLGLMAVLVVCASVSDLVALDTASARMKVSGSFLSLTLAVVLLGGAPAAIVGVVSILVGWLRWRYSRAGLLNNLVAYAWFPLLGGIAFDAA